MEPEDFLAILAEFGDTVTLKRRGAVPAEDGDWPDPDATEGDWSENVPAIVIEAMGGKEWTLTGPGLIPAEGITAWFQADVDLTNVTHLRWRRNVYTVGDHRSISMKDVVMAQTLSLEQAEMEVERPHG